MSLELILGVVLIYLLIGVYIWFKRAIIKKKVKTTVEAISNIEGFSTDYYVVCYNNGIRFDYTQQKVVLMLQSNIYMHHISQIYRWALQCDPLKDEHGNKIGDTNFRIWFRIRDINHPQLSMKLLDGSFYYIIEEAILTMQDGYHSKELLHDPSTATAVILTAIEPEVKAVLSDFKQYEEEIVKGTVFFIGLFEGKSNPWRVASAEIRAGNVMASSISERAFEHFNPQVALFVGVAGGLKDVRLGDVVAATKVYAYESGKETDGKFKPRPDLNWSSYAMEQRARATRTRGTWTERLKLQHDKEPVAYIGPIAAGEKVVGATRSETAKIIRQTYSDAVTVEMEGRGFVNALHTNEGVSGIVIRGISDLLDNKSESDAEGWQEIAADSAAAFAFELLASHRP